MLKIFDFILNKREDNSEFDKVFLELKGLGRYYPKFNRTFKLLKELNFETSEFTSNELLTEFTQLHYSSNTTNVFYFYFPIVTHILYYKPQFEKEILGYLVGPNFANGTSDTREMIDMIIGAMNYKLQENVHYLTQESRKWITNELPKMEKEIEREIQICWKELN